MIDHEHEHEHEHQHEHAACHDECAAVAGERNRYFTGKVMTARDFQADQDYVLSHHRLHNRLLHGWGIACGLRVGRHRNADCHDWVVVRSGIALDCCGRELILDCDTPIRVPLEPEEGCERRALLLCARYAERKVEHLPVLYHEGGCDPAHREANRVRECVELEFRDADDFAPDCWITPDGGMNAPCRDDCDEDGPCSERGCLDPSCPCGTCVPLARIEYDPRHPGKGFKIDLEGRRELAPPRDYLTRIAGINWDHGKGLSLADLEQRDGRLEIRFDRRILPAKHDATGVNRFTFVVQYGGVQRDLEFLPYDQDHPPGLSPDDDCVARFTIDPDYLDRRRNRNNIAGNVVYVALKCDFILDCHGNPVSGAHLRGRLPNVGAAPGGIFESWFRVTSKEDDEGEEAS